MNFVKKYFDVTNRYLNFIVSTEKMREIVV